MERLLHRLLPLAATSAFALVTASAIAADAPAAPDPDIVRLVREVSPARLETYVRTLAGFGTRHSLSATDDPKRGIGAARRWIRATLDRCAAESGARLKVEFDEFIQEATPRIPRATSLTNVVATLEGVDPQARGRLLVVSGHYDSMCGNVMNSECDAPGANDDASGTAVMIELACTFAKSRFPATLVFMAVAGEEQGLLGAAHWAKVAREKGMNVEAMITNDIVGNAHDENGHRDASTVRLFAEGVPAGKEVTEEWQRRLETGGENDSPARELARTIRDAAQRYVPEMTVKVVYRRDRYLRGGVYARDAGQILVVDKLRQVAVLDAVDHAHVLMLVAEILVRFGETHGGVPLREERNVIAAAQVTVAPIHHLDCHFRHVALRRVADRARQLARR